MQSPTTKTQRTRRDVVQAAIDCWSTDSSASLGAVADHAGVGRTTVNRHFPTRAALVDAVDQECRARFVAAAGRARPDEGTGLEALLRGCVEIVDLGAVLGLIFADNALIDPDTWADSPGLDGVDRPVEGDVDAISAAVARGQADGSIDPALPPDWVVTWTWTSLLAAWLTTQAGTTSRHDTALLLTRTLAGGVSL